MCGLACGGEHLNDSRDVSTFATETTKFAETLPERSVSKVEML